MSPGDPETRFQSTEAYYAEYRPGYGDRTVSYLADRFDLDADSRVLDLGCGAGQITVPLAAHAGEVVGLDPNETMLEYARERAGAAGRENVRLRAGSDADLPDVVADRAPFRLATMGRAFHWMDQERTLDCLHGLAGDAGGVAVLNDPEWLVRGTADWQDAVHDVVADYLDDVPERTGPVSYDDDPWDELVAEHGFGDVETVTFDVRREWTVADAVGYVFSLSYCSPAAFGAETDAFERDARERLAAFEEPLLQDASVAVIAGRK